MRGAVTAVRYLAKADAAGCGAQQQSCRRQDATTTAEFHPNILSRGAPMPD
jgi:hypothetical protein